MRQSVAVLKLSRLSKLAGLGEFSWLDMTFREWSAAVAAGLPRAFPTQQEESK